MTNRPQHSVRPDDPWAQSGLESEPAAPWTAQEVQALEARDPSRSPWWVVRVQALVGGLLALAWWLLGTEPASQVRSTLWGAAAVVLPSSAADYLHNPPPAYPRMSRRMGEQGTVLLRVFISAEGRAEKAEIRTSSGYARLDEAAVIAHVAARLARYKVPVRVFAIDDFPRTPSPNGLKIQRHRLRERAEALLGAAAVNVP